MFISALDSLGINIFLHSHTFFLLKKPPQVHSKIYALWFLEKDHLKAHILKKQLRMLQSYMVTGFQLIFRNFHW